MPVIKSAKKKLRQDIKRQEMNSVRKKTMKLAIKAARVTPSDETVVAAVKATDKAAKHFIIHKNKASRIKSMLSKLLSGAIKAGLPQAPTKAKKKKAPIKKTLSSKKKKK